MSSKAGEDDPTPPTKSTPPRSRNGWDGKLRVGRNMEPVEPEGSSPPESDDEDADEDAEGPAAENGTAVAPASASAVVNPQYVHVPGGEIEADEDLLEGIEENEEDIDLNHSRISSIPALQLQRFKSVIRLCLRQNEISTIALPDSWASAASLQDLDLYDNQIAHIKGLDDLTELTILDLSFNTIKHIKRVNHLKKLKDLFFVQNKIVKIEGLDGLTQLTNLELGGNRIRDIENLDTLENLTELYLGKNKITELKNLSPLQNLTLLSIQSNRITSPSLSHLSTLPHLTDLYISHNDLDSLTPLSSCKTLKIIDISSNPITSLAGLEPLSDLEEVWASSCKLESFEEIGSILGDKENLETVYLEGNPLELRQRALYRNKVRLALPQVRQIDATFVPETRQ